jgi:hypothetical protein
MLEKESEDSLNALTEVLQIGVLQIKDKCRLTGS